MTPKRDEALLLRAQLTRQFGDLTVSRTDEKIIPLQHKPSSTSPSLNSSTSQGAGSDAAWDDIIARMKHAPQYINAGETLVSHPGHLFVAVGAQQLAGAPECFSGALTDAAKTQLGSGKACTIRGRPHGTTPFAVVSAELLADLSKSGEQVWAAANY